MKNILITGATSGIGKGLAYYLKRTGNYSPVILGRSTSKLQVIAEDLDTTYIAYDLNNLNDIGDIFEQLKNKGISLDGMVHCAGISPLMTVENNDISIMQETFNVNVLSFIELVKNYSLFYTKEDWGSIVAISSVAAKVASNRQTVYGASKAALEEAIRCIAKELLNNKIRVNCIAPGVVKTEMLDSLFEQSKQLKEKIEKLYPLGVADTDSISKLVEYLLSDDARFITGRCFEVDSGFLIAK